MVAGEKLFQDLRCENLRPEETFILVVDGSDGPVSLEWMRRSGSTDGWELELWDARGSERPLGENGRVELPAGRSEFEIRTRRIDPETPVLRGLRLEIQPNPTTSSAMFRYHVPSAGRVLLQVFDPRGGRVWVEETAVGPGEYTTIWDGRTLDGERAASGIYFVRADVVSRSTGEAEHRIEKLVLVR
jgi:hypothetical protein